MTARKPYRMVLKFEETVLKTAEFRATPEQMQLLCDILNVFITPRGVQIEVDDSDIEEVKS